MKTIVLSVLAVVLLDQTAVGASNSGAEPTVSSRIESSIAKKTTSETLDKLVREYVKAVQSAESVDVLTEYLPAARVKKLRDGCTVKERAEWLQFRKTMPPIVKLVGVNLQKDRAVLTYRCPDAPPFFGGKKVKKMAQITLVREDGNWKVALEHFAPAKSIKPSKTARRT